MDKTRINIAIIEPSEIIFEGLYNLLMKNSYDCFVYQLNNIDELCEKYSTINFSVVVINPVLLQNNSKCFIKAKKQKQKIYWIGIIYSFVNDEILKSFDDHFKITDDTNLIINKIINKTEQKPNNQENDLSDREIEVLKLLTKGFSNKEIAARLNISTHTVISHRKNIIEKTGIKSLSGLTIYAITKKIIPLDK